MSAVVYLCSVRNHIQRLEYNQKKLRCAFPEAPDFMAKVKDHNLQHLLSVPVGAPSFVITGLARVRRGMSKQDILLQCGHRDEFAVWNHYWRGASNLFTIEVEETFVLHQPLPIFTCLETQPQGPKGARLWISFRLQGWVVLGREFPSRKHRGVVRQEAGLEPFHRKQPVSA